MGGLLHWAFRGGAAATPSPLLAVPNVTAHPSTVSVPIILLLLVCGFNVPIKGLSSEYDDVKWRIIAR